MSDVNVLIDRSRHFAEEFPQTALSIRPRLSTIVLTCLDARVDPARIFELELGDAAVIRNAGGRVTDGVLTDLAVVGFLAAGLEKGSAMTPELVIVHHTDCGMSRLVDPKAQSVLGERLGIQPEEVAAMAISDPRLSVQSDIERLRRAPGVPDSLLISGLVYDVADGTTAQVVESAPGHE